MSAGASRRGKPQVADVNADDAASNISMKLAYLQVQLDLARTGRGDSDVILKCLPDSRTAFNKWCATSLPREMQPPPFRANAAITLKKNVEAFGSVNAAVLAVKRLARAVSGKAEKPSKLEKITTLKQEVHLLEAMKRIAERELVRSQKRIDQLALELQAARAEVASKTREFDAALKDLRDRLKAAQHEKTRPLKLVDIDK